MLKHIADDPTAQDATGLVLEVVRGPREGARVGLESGRSLTIGHDYDNDVVLRHPSVRGVRARLTNAEGSVTVSVDAGEVGLFGLTLGPGGTMVLPCWVPFSVGDAMVAIGPADAGGWKACRRLARESAAARRALPSSAPAGGAVGAPPAQAEPAAGAARALPRWWPAPVAFAAILLLGAAVMLSLPDPQGGPSVDAARVVEPVRGALSADGYGHLRVEPTASGTPRVSGLVDRDEDRARVAARLRAAGLAATLDLASGEQLARQVGDVLRLNGVRAEVRHVGRGVVEARMTDPGPAARARAETAVRRDVPGLAGLTIELGSEGARPVVEAAPARAAAPDPAKRVVSVVYGRNGYVVTVDGARYFEGAVLPSGHRIARIAGNEVHLERDGLTSRLAL